MNIKTVVFAGSIGSVLYMALPVYLGAINKAETYPLDIHFDFAKADLKMAKESKKEFDRVAGEMNAFPYAKLEIDGYTDIVGPQAYNQKLSEERALAVRQRFIERYGISPERIVVRAFGKMRPAADNGTSEGRAWNRRAEARIFRLDPVAAGTDRQSL